MKALFVVLFSVAATAANSLPHPKNFTVDEDFQLVPDSNGKLHLVNVRDSVPEDKPPFVGTRDMVFRLFTRSNPNTSQAIALNDSAQLAASHFNPAHQTRFMVHGWLGGGEGGIDLRVMKEYLKRGDFNFFLVDWSVGAVTINYILARSRVNEVGDVIAQYCSFLNQPFTLISLIGHSLGGQAVGAAGKRTIEKVNSIIALDPARPLFFLNKPADRIDHTDANFVEMHVTDFGRLGFEHPVAHANFYPNWGTSQPGCGKDITGICGHILVKDFLIESINTNNPFVADRCRNLDDIRERNCVISGESRIMGGEPVMDGPSSPGSVFFLTTNPDAPFSKGPR